LNIYLQLLDKDTSKASEQLVLICEGGKRSNDYGSTKFSRAFNETAHSLYNLSYFVYKGELSDKVEMPNQSNFCYDFATFQKENNFQRGKLFLEYPEPITLINTILKTTPPEISLYQPYLVATEYVKASKKYYLDTETFQKNMVKNILCML